MCDTILLLSVVNFDSSSDSSKYYLSGLQYNSLHAFSFYHFELVILFYMDN